MHAIRVLIADDHPVFRQGLLSVFRTQPEFKIVGEAVDGKQAIELTQKLHPDILLLDLVMPRLAGLDTLRELGSASTPVRTIVLTAAVEKEQIAEALQLGARGIVLKDAPTDVLLASIRTVMKGEFWVGQEKVTDLVDILRSYLPQEKDPKNARKTFGLTVRELDVVAAIASGFTNREIAQKFSISEQTVKHHLRNIFDKVGVSNRLELALFAINHQLVAP